MRGQLLKQGQGASYGNASGRLIFVNDEKSAVKAKKGDIVYSAFLPPRSAMLAKEASGFLVCGSEADHTISYLREAWKPAVLVDSLEGFQKGKQVTIDGSTGEIFEGIVFRKNEEHREFNGKTRTKLYLQLGVPHMAKKAAQLNSRGISLLRLNLTIQELGIHPEYFFSEGREKELQKILETGIQTIAKEFYPRPVWVRTMDFDSSELAQFKGGEKEKKEVNPMLGLRGLARDLHSPHILEVEYRAIANAIKSGLSNIGVVYPLVRDVSEYRRAKFIMKEMGLNPHKDVKVGTIFETPSSCLQVKEFIKEGLDLAFFGINDMVQYTMAVERTNSHVRHLYNPAQSGVLHLLYYLLKECKRHDIETTMTFLTPLKPYLPTMLKHGLTSITLQADRLNEIGTLLQKIELNSTLKCNGRF